MISLQRIYGFFFFLGLFFLPFNSFEGFPGLGEFSRESAFPFFVIGLFLLILGTLITSRIKFPLLNRSYLTFLLFVGFCIIGLLLNASSVSESFFKYTTGIERFIRQFTVLIISGVLFFGFYYNTFNKYKPEELFLKIRKIFLIAFVVISVYALLEILVVYFGLSQLFPVLELFNLFPFTEVKLDYTFKRISSVTWEPPYLAIYLITIGGWMFSYILTSKGIKKFIPAIMVLALTFFSGSRTALVVVLVQFIAFMFTLANINKFRKYFAYLGILILIITSSILIISKGAAIQSVNEKLQSLNFKENLTKSISNKSRFGIQYANLQVFKNHPLIGVGYGQQAYYAQKFYPDWATKDNYEFKYTYLNEELKAFPPGFNLYIRLLAETGIFGLLLFLLFMVSLGLQIYQLYRTQTGVSKVFVITLWISYIGFAINWLQVDTVRIFGFWICMALVMYVHAKNKSIQ